MPMRKLRIWAALLIVLALLAACGGEPAEPAIDSSPLPDAAAPSEAPSEPAAASDEVVTIGFGAQEYERRVFEPLIAEFNNQNPGIQVQFVPLDEFMRPEPGESFDPSQILRRVVGAADTAAIFGVSAESIQQGLLYDLRPLIDGDADFDVDDYYPGALDAGSSNGGTYLLPRSQRVQLLSYNKDLWAGRGLPPPKPDWSWRDLIGAAEQLAQKRGSEVDVYGLIDWGSGFMVLMNELSAAGIDLFGTPSDQQRLDRPEIAAALDRVAALAKAGAIYFQPRDPNTPIAGDAFQQMILDGRAAIWPREMLFSGPSGAQPSFAIGTAVYPDLPQIFYGIDEGFVISSGTQHPQQAWRWLSFLSRQEIKPPYEQQDTLGQLPARKSLAERSGYWSKLDDETAAAVQAAIAHPRAPLPPSAFDGRVFEPLVKALNAVVAGEQGATAALNAAQAELDARLAQAASTPSPAPNSGPVVVATPIAETVPEGATAIAFGVFEWQAEQARKLAREFNQNSPDVFVKVETIDMSGPNGPTLDTVKADCFAWWGPPEPAQITATLDLQPLIDADAGFDIADYPPALLAPFRQGGGLYGLPHGVTFRVLSYNKDAFDDAGLSYPTAAWTTDDFLHAAQRLTSGSGTDQRYGYVTDGPQTQDLIFFLSRFGAQPTQGSGDDEHPNFGDPKVAQAIRFYLDLLKYSPHKEFHGYKAGESFGGELFDLIRQGRAGMSFQFGNTFFFVGPGEQPQYTRAVAPPPLGNESLAPEDFQASGLFISAATQQPQACWQWLKFLSSSPADLGMQGTYPARISVAESEAFLKDAAPGTADVYAAYRAALERSGSSTREPFYRSKIDYFWFFRAVDRALQGKGLERELADAQSLTEQYLACLDGGDPPGCAKQVDPTYAGWSSSS
jgi:ABC-type glycerol-3-phosphate transport system substrate-binding protein